MRKFVTSLAVALALCACEAPVPDQLAREPRDGALTITQHPGGVISAIWDRFLELAYFGVSVRVAGGCYSACTMALSETLPLNCSTWNGVYHFHGAARVDNGRVIEEVNPRPLPLWTELPDAVKAALPEPEQWRSTRWNILTARDLEGIQGSEFRGCM